MTVLPKILASVCLLGFLAAPAAAQAGPCEKAVDRYIDCIKDIKQKKEVEAHRQEMIDSCNASKKAKTQARDCLKTVKCRPFLVCMDKE